MGHNVWRDEEAWPLARTRYTPWYLHAGGTLSPEEPASTARPSTYTYDPRDPMPTVGGQTLMSGGSDGGQAWQPGPVWALCADGTRWELVCWRFGITCATSHRRWQYGRSLIAWRLNGQG